MLKLQSKGKSSILDLDFHLVDILCFSKSDRRNEEVLKLVHIVLIICKNINKTQQGDGHLRRDTAVELTPGWKPYVVGRCRGCMEGIDLEDFFSLRVAQELTLALAELHS